MRGQRFADPSEPTAVAASALPAVASDSAAMALAAMALDSCWCCRPYGPPIQRAYNLEAT
jgi:hypothetical protein